MALDFLIYITHTFLLIIRKDNQKDIRTRCVNVVSTILCTLCLSAISVCYMVMISKQILSYNKALFLIIIIALCVSIFIGLTKRYTDKRYNDVTHNLENRFSFSQSKIIAIFFITFLVPILLVGIGLVFLRQLLY